MWTSPIGCLMFTVYKELRISGKVCRARPGSIAQIKCVFAYNAICIESSILNKICSNAGERLPFVQYVVSLAIVAAIQEVCKQHIGVKNSFTTIRVHTWQT